MWFLGNIATTPEGFGFMGLLYGGNAGFSNLARFKLPQFDKLYEEGRAMPDGAERNKMLQRMSELVTAYSPWNLHAYRYENVLVQPWLTATNTTRSTGIPGPTMTSTASGASRQVLSR
jgi:ABC-type transport system substrate-binding protein